MKIRRSTFQKRGWRIEDGEWLLGSIFKLPSSIFALLSILVSISGGRALANPTGMTVGSGSAVISQNGPQLTITTSQNAFLNWQSFNIAAGETTIFNQPSITSVAVNRINDPNPSQIFGSLQANGIVVLINSSGFYFGPNSYVKTGGLIVSTANCIPPQNSGGSWEFNGPPPAASIINYGKINVVNGGAAFLIAQNVANFGDITAPGGTIGIAAGQDVLVSERPDGRGLSMKVNLPEGSVDNEGHLVADAGTISVNAQAVNQNGFVQANSVRAENGVIELVASDKLNLGANSQILANGDASAGGSSGGNVTLKSGNTFSDSAGSQIDVIGGSQGGNGGNVEISAPKILSLNSRVAASAQTGWSGGLFALDPNNIVLGSSGATSGGTSGTIDESGSGSTTYYADVFTAFQNITAGQILLNASGNIYVGDGVVNSDGSFTPGNGVTWDLTGSAGGQTSGNLTLQAGGDISFVDGSLITDANSWSVTLKAGVNNFTTGTIQSGTGNIFLNGGPAGDGVGGSIQTTAGNIDLEAGRDITVGSGYVITTGGGSISAHALAGNIDTGSDAAGYVFESGVDSLNQAYDLSGGLGGISTAAGGDVTLIAGGDVTSVLPGVNGYIYDGTFVPAIIADYTTAGAGAYGSAPGNVTVVAGGNVTGHYLAANGYGGIYAGAAMTMDANGNPINPIVATDANNNPITEKDVNGNPVTDASGNPVYVYALNPGSTGSAGTSQSNPNLSLSLISGGWNVMAAHNILLQEVNNPNGVFDTSAGAAFNHYFDYAPGDYVNLSAGNLVQLGAPTASLPRATGLAIPFIYPSILNITAGDGGVTLGTAGSPASLILFPSPQGSLTVNTPGSLIGSLSAIQGAPQIFNLIVSDSGGSQYKSSSSFGLNDHAATPVHLGSPTPLELNIGGDMNYVLLGAPEAAQISVGGNMNNSRFQGMNLSSDPSFQVQITEADGSTRTVTVDPAVTSINVTGDIYNRSIFTDLAGVTPAEAANLFYLDEAFNPSIPATTLATSFYYNPATETLTYQNISGVTLLNVLKLLNNFTYQVSINGVPQWADPYETIPLTQTVSVLGDPATPGTVAYTLLNQYNQLGATPNNATASGFIIGGGGQFDISARSIDLGTSAGILSKGVGLYKVGSSYPLARLFGNGGVFDSGANISVTTTGNHSANGDLIGNANSDLYVTSGNLVGDLDMFSSSIATLNGGNVSINTGGDANAGSSVFSVNTLGVRGIYTTAQGDVSVIANGDVNVNGSRIATYDGGNVTVESLNGSINAGNGASLPAAVLGYFEDPVTHAVYFTNPQIPFSGILALTFPARDAFYPAPAATLGNILVEAPNGSINANAAGILQIPLNNLNYPDATTTVLAGYELRDGMGNRVTAANMADGTPVLVSAGRDINANGSGIIAGNANLDASGDINGLIFARDNININAQQNINVTAFGQGNVNVNSSGGTISGTIIGVGAVSVSGGSIDASLISANVSGVTSGQSGLGQGTAANATSQGLANNDSTQAAAASDQSAEDEKKKKGKQIALAQKVSRVTVILPPKKISETQTKTPGT
jgi:filamentous hemagglutinin family protein